VLGPDDPAVLAVKDTGQRVDRGCQLIAPGLEGGDVLGVVMASSCSSAACRGIVKSSGTPQRSQRLPALAYPFDQKATTAVMAVVSCSD